MLTTSFKVTLSSLALAGAVLLGLAGPGEAQEGQPWLDPKLSPERRAELAVAALTQDEKLLLVRGYFAIPFDGKRPPEKAIGGAGYVPGIARLRIPALQESDAGVGVANPADVRPGDQAVPLPSGLATAATWNPKIAEAGGRMIGKEARQKGFNVLLAGGADLVREPRNGRNFEYAGEDPLLAGTMVGATVRGIQSNHILSTIKHFALNDQETGRMVVSSDVPWPAARESDLLAFEIAIEQGQPGSIMCAYNVVNGEYASQSPYLLERILKRDWHYPGFVMSDWGAVHDAAAAANAGLDQESGAELDTKIFFEDDLALALKAGRISATRLDGMVSRILRSMFAGGIVDQPPQRAPLQVEADSAVAETDAEQALVLLKNQPGFLPLGPDLKRIVVIGSHSDVGVLSGGGSSQVVPVGGIAVAGLGPKDFPGPMVYDPSSPLAAIRRSAPGAEVEFVSGDSLDQAAARARGADVVILFAHQWMAESFDAASLALPDGQDALIRAVAAANRRTVVVLETGGPVTMPWLDSVAGVLEAWYPGARGGAAVARVLFGQVNPSGRLPVSFPVSESQLPRPTMLDPELPGVVSGPSPTADYSRHFHVDYSVEGPDVGYRWYARQKLEPLFPFGFGLSYTSFAYSGLGASVKDNHVTVTFTVTNTGKRAGADVPQLYVGLPDGSPHRLAGWGRVELDPGSSTQVQLKLDPRMLARFKADDSGWRVTGGRYRLALASHSGDSRGPSTEAQLAAADLAP